MTPEEKQELFHQMDDYFDELSENEDFENPVDELWQLARQIIEAWKGPKILGFYPLLSGGCWFEWEHGSIRCDLTFEDDRCFLSCENSHTGFRLQRSFKLKIEEILSSLESTAKYLSEVSSQEMPRRNGPIKS